VEFPTGGKAREFFSIVLEHLPFLIEKNRPGEIPGPTVIVWMGEEDASFKVFLTPLHFWPRL